LSPPCPNLIAALLATGGSGDFGQANFSIGVGAGPAGQNSRIGFYVRSQSQGGWHDAGLYLDASPDGAQVAISAERFSVLAGFGDYKKVFVVDQNGLWIDTAYIRNLTTDKITFLDGSIFTSAIVPQAVTATVAVQAAGGALPRNVETTVVNGVVPVVAGSTVALDFMGPVQYGQATASSAVAVHIVIRRNGTVIYSVIDYIPIVASNYWQSGDTNTGVDNFFGGVITMSFQDTSPPVGDVNYAVTISPSQNCAMETKNMRATVFKR
jgi:hypothetical protein